MPADNERDALDRWLNQQVTPLPPPPGTFELITKRARRRKIRKAVVTVASAAVAAAAVGVAVPLSTSLHLTTPPTDAVAAGRTTTPSGSAGSNTTLGTGTATPTKSAGSSITPSRAATSGSASPSTPASTSTANPGYLPPNYVPSSVTWDSTTTGWVMGPAGTPGQCANTNPSICTSIARTDDGGQTWQGLSAPPTGGPMSATGVTGLRFLNANYGWAFGPELWATVDGRHWNQVDTKGRAVTDLEAGGPGNRAYALFGDCAPPAGSTGDTIANCTSYTLETAVAGSDQWTPVGGIPANLALGGGQKGSALIELAGAVGNNPPTGYLVAPDGTLYAGPLDGTAWHKVGKLPCTPGAAANDGLPQGVMLAPDGMSATGATRLALVCGGPGLGDTTVYLSQDNGTSWTKQATVGTAGLSHIGVPESLTAIGTDGTLILATTGSTSSPGGIYLLPPGASQWQPATLADPSGKTSGFTYVGMTSPTQGVALGGSPDLHAIWMTTDGGKTWQIRPIQK